MQNDRRLISDSKDLRGFFNIDTADLLCPLSLKDRFEDDPEYVALIVDIWRVPG